MQVLAIDIETTGLKGNKHKPNNSDLLEIGLVFYDSEKYKGVSYKELDSLISKHTILVHRPTKYLQGGLVAFDMHQDTLLPLHRKLDVVENKESIIREEQSRLQGNHNFYVVSPNQAVDKVWQIIFSEGWDVNFLQEKGETHISNTLTIAGKNPSGFDIPYLKDYLKDFGRTIRTRTRVFDPTVFFADFERDRLPDLEECKNIASESDPKFPNGSVKHTAVEDAMDVVNLIHFTRAKKLYAKQEK